LEKVRKREEAVVAYLNLALLEPLASSLEELLLEEAVAFLPEMT
jgi:hypothetical protein